MSALLHWLAAATGIGDQAGPGYSAWSGILGCLTQFGILGGLYHHLICHTRGCWRIGRHPVTGTPYKVCRRCHPAIPNHGARLEQIHAAHRAHRDRQC